MYSLPDKPSSLPELDNGETSDKEFKGYQEPGMASSFKYNASVYNSNINDETEEDQGSLKPFRLFGS